jgi:hypothetical protein
MSNICLILTRYGSCPYNGSRMLCVSSACHSVVFPLCDSIECLLRRLIRRPEHLIARHSGISRQTEGIHSVITWSVSQSVLRHRVLYKLLLCSVLCLYDSCESMFNQPALWTPCSSYTCWYSEDGHSWPKHAKGNLMLTLSITLDYVTKLYIIKGIWKDAVVAESR